MNTPPTPTDTLPDPNLATTTVPSPVLARRLRGKIPSLPKAQRDTINALLLDGATYAAVIQHMAAQGVELNLENVSNWYQTGFQIYLAHLQRADYQRARYEAATDLLQDTDTSRLPQAGLQTAAAQIYDLLGHFTASAVANNVADDPDKYTRIINSLSRLARETLALQKYQDACARARAALQPLKDPKRKLSDTERHALVHLVDDILGIAVPEGDDPFAKYMKDGKFRYVPSEWAPNGQNTAASPGAPASSQATSLGAPAPSPAASQQPPTNSCGKSTPLKFEMENSQCSLLNAVPGSASLPTSLDVPAEKTTPSPPPTDTSHSTAA